MTEDLSTMEKKHYSTSAPTKLVSQEQVRSRQDGASNNAKLFTRPTRRLESPTGSVGSSKSRMESTSGRKPTPQKSKAMDKRPRTRGGGNLQPVEEDEFNGMGSLQAPGSKKHNLNHLLNFHFTPRENRSWSTESWRSHNTHPGGGWRARINPGMVGNRPKFSKENFLQAKLRDENHSRGSRACEKQKPEVVANMSCQFLVKSTGDYSSHKYNPDRLVEWDMIEQIHIRVAGEFPSCPICLASPVAAKMTKCGHIFCWPCLLHYLALSDKKSRKCPICYEPICKDELKSVVATHWEDASVGEEIEMQLMIRKKGCFEAMPLMCKNGATFDWESLFAKLIVVTPAQVQSIVLDREYKELKERYDEDKDCPEVCFIEEALRELETRSSNTSPSVSIPKDVKVTNVAGALNLPNLHWSSTDSESYSPTDEHGFEEVKHTSMALPMKEAGACQYEEVQPAKTTLESANDCFYFYQAVRGENIFLHPVNMAMLWKSFGSDPATWPQVLQLRVIEKENIVMMDDLRKRLKFLNHLPITSNVQLVEVELRSPMISEVVISEFSQQLESRKKRRVQRSKEEKRRERKHEAEERKRAYKTPCPQLGSTQEFPAYAYEDVDVDFLIAATEDPGGIGRPSDNDDDRHSVDSFSSYSTSPSSMSFAKIVAQPQTTSGAWGTSRVAGRAWGVASVTPEKSNSHTDAETDPDDYEAVPTYRRSMSDAIAKAIANISVSEDGNSPVQTSGPGKKKGRKKGKVLFATGMDCNN